MACLLLGRCDDDDDDDDYDGRRGSSECHARMRLHLSVAFQRVPWAKAGGAEGRG